MIARCSLAALLLTFIACAAGDASAAERAPNPAGASDALRSSEPAVGRAVVASLALLFAGVAVWQLGGRRSQARRGQAEAAEPAALDANTPRNETVTKIFLRHAPAQVAALGQALQAGDGAQISARAHKLKGSCLAIGAPRMAELCALLEQGTSERSQHYAELRRSLEYAERELTEQLVVGGSAVGRS